MNLRCCVLDDIDGVEIVPISEGYRFPEQTASQVLDLPDSVVEAIKSRRKPGWRHPDAGGDLGNVLEWGLMG